MRAGPEVVLKCEHQQLEKIACLFSLKGIYRAAVLPGLWLKVEWLWQEEMPLVIDVLREIKMID